MDADLTASEMASILKRTGVGEAAPGHATKPKKPKRVKFELCPRNIHHPLRIKDLQSLLLWVYDLGPAPKWCMLQNRNAVFKVVLVLVPELDASLLLSDRTAAGVVQPNLIPPTAMVYQAYPSNFVAHSLLPRTCKIFEHVVVTRADGERGQILSPMNSLMSLRSDRKRIEYKKIQVESLLLDPDALFSEGYPPHPFKYHSVYIAECLERTRDIETKHSLLAVDCEMCLTARGKECTRVSIVDMNGHIVYDSLIRPEHPIIDYCTQYSGITAEMLSDVHMTLESVRQDLLGLISKDTVLVGHSLNNDLYCLGIVHERVVDTSVIYSHVRGDGFKPSLQWLVQRYLGKEIQASGHDSIIDATCCIELLKLKLERGHDFGRTNCESLIEKIKEKQVSGIGIIDMVEGFCPDNYVQCAEPEFFPTMETHLKSFNFVFGRCSAIHKFNSSSEHTEEQTKAAYHDLDRQIESFYHNLPSNTLVIVTSGCGNKTEFQRMFNEKNAARPLSRWSASEREDMEKVAFGPRHGISMFSVTR